MGGWPTTISTSRSTFPFPDAVPAITANPVTLDRLAESDRGPQWHTDAYHRSPGAEAMLTLHGGKHFLGGVMGYDLAETDDQNPDRLAVTQRLTWSYLQTAFTGNTAWPIAQKALTEYASSLGQVDTNPS